MTLWIDRRLFLPVRVRYVEPSGDVTEYRLDDVRINLDLPEDRFVLELPPDVEVHEIDLERGSGRADPNCAAALRPSEELLLRSIGFPSEADTDKGKSLFP